MRDKHILGTPFFACIGVLAFFLTVGVQLYLKGAPASEEQAKLEKVAPPIKVAPPVIEKPNTNVAKMKSSETPVAEMELSSVSRPNYSASGTVSSDSGERIESADVRLFLVQGDQSRELTRMLSDSEGHFEASLRSLDDLSTESLLAANVEVLVVGKNHMPVRQRIEPTKEASPFNTEVTLPSGHFLRGRILNDLGKPIAGCSVDLYLDCPPGTVRGDTKRTDKTDKHGEYLFGWKRGQGLRFVDAEHPAWGKATIALNSLSATEDQVLDDIRLDAGGTLSGLVRCKLGGDLLPGVRIDAHPSKSIEGAKRKWTFTGSDGAFHLSGLVPGEYKLWIEGATQPIGTWKTGSRDIELEVDLVRLVVSVRDPRDNPLPGQRVQFVNIAGEHSAPLIKTASDVAKGHEAVAIFSPSVSPEFGESARTGHRAVAMRATSTTLPTYEELIDIPSDACRVNHTFTLLSSKDLGSLRIRVQDSESKVISNPAIMLTSLVSGEVVSNLLDREEDPNVWLSTLAPGEYSLRVEPTKAYDAKNMILGLSPKEPIRVRRGHETQVDLQAPIGGRIRIYIEPEEVQGVDPLDYPAILATATIAPVASQAPMHEAPLFEVEQHGERVSELPVRTSATSFDVLEPGDYRLRLTCTGFQTKLITLKVVANEITDARIELSIW